MKVVMLDRNSIGMDVDVSIFSDFGEFSEYDTMDFQSCRNAIHDADVIIFNKSIMNEEMLQDAKNIKLLCATATGYDNIDLTYVKTRGIAVCNIRDYSTPAVVQHTFALALYVLEKISYYDDYVRSGEYSNQLGFSNFDEKYGELANKTWGIVGLGNIGKGVAKVAESFGCRVIYYSASGNNCSDVYERVEFDTLLKESDIISLHCPLTDRTRNLFNQDAFKKMKNTAILVNVARGPVVNDADLYTALSNNLIAGAGLDVLSKEPMEKTNPLAKIKDGRRLIITPHMAWASVESRTRCMQEVYQNIKSYIKNEVRNRVDL